MFLTIFTYIHVHICSPLACASSQIVFGQNNRSQPAGKQKVKKVWRKEICLGLRGTKCNFCNIRRRHKESVKNKSAIFQEPGHTVSPAPAPAARRFKIIFNCGNAASLGPISALYLSLISEPTV